MEPPGAEATAPYQRLAPSQRDRPRSHHSHLDRLAGSLGHRTVARESPATRWGDREHNIVTGRCAALGAGNEHAAGGVDGQGRIEEVIAADRHRLQTPNARLRNRQAATTPELFSARELNVRTTVPEGVAAEPRVGEVERGRAPEGLNGRPAAAGHAIRGADRLGTVGAAVVARLLDPCDRQLPRASNATAAPRAARSRRATSVRTLKLAAPADRIARAPEPWHDPGCAHPGSKRGRDRRGR